MAVPFGNYMNHGIASAPDNFKFAINLNPVAWTKAEGRLVCARISAILLTHFALLFHHWSRYILGETLLNPVANQFFCSKITFQSKYNRLEHGSLSPSRLVSLRRAYTKVHPPFASRAYSTSTERTSRSFRPLMPYTVASWPKVAGIRPGARQVACARDRLPSTRASGPKEQALAKTRSKLFLEWVLEALHLVIPPTQCRARHCAPRLMRDPRKATARP